jgi:hypothetical protein
MKRVTVLDIEVSKKLNVIERGQLALLRSYLPFTMTIKEENEP